MSRFDPADRTDAAVVAGCALIALLPLVALLKWL